MRFIVRERKQGKAILRRFKNKCTDYAQLKQHFTKRLFSILQNEYLSSMRGLSAAAIAYPVGGIIGGLHYRFCSGYLFSGYKCVTIYGISAWE